MNPRRTRSNPKFAHEGNAKVNLFRTIHDAYPELAVIAGGARRDLADASGSSRGQLKRRHGERDVCRADRILIARRGSAQRGSISRRAE